MSSKRSNRRRWATRAKRQRPIVHKWFQIEKKKTALESALTFWCNISCVVHKFSLFRFSLFFCFYFVVLLPKEIYCFRYKRISRSHEHKWTQSLNEKTKKKKRIENNRKSKEIIRRLCAHTCIFLSSFSVSKLKSTWKKGEKKLKWRRRTIATATITTKTDKRLKRENVKEKKKISNRSSRSLRLRFLILRQSVLLQSPSLVFSCLFVTSFCLISNRTNFVFLFILFSERLWPIDCDRLWLPIHFLFLSFRFHLRLEWWDKSEGRRWKIWKKWPRPAWRLDLIDWNRLAGDHCRRAETFEPFSSFIACCLSIELISKTLKRHKTKFFVLSMASKEMHLRTLHKRQWPHLVFLSVAIECGTCGCADERSKK